MTCSSCVLSTVVFRDESLLISGDMFISSNLGNLCTNDNKKKIQIFDKVALMTQIYTKAIKQIEV